MTKATWIGQTIGGRYEIQELLGQGGMSAVYKANDPNLRRIVAVKLIHPHLSENEEFVRRFEEEATAVAQLRHPNIIQVYDFNNDDDTYYIVFEFVPGETIQARLKRMKSAGRPIEVNEAVNIVAKAADGLQYAHVKGLIHRDIKPANIILNVLGDPIIMDFGIAKIMGGTQHTATGAVLGTARYMSPEQIKGERIDPRTDIYSLGVTLFEMLGGRPPFESDSAMTLMMMHMTDPVPDLRDLRSDIPAALVAVVNKALAKNKQDRYETAAEFANALRSLSPDASTANMTMVENEPRHAADPGRTVLDSAAAAAAVGAATGSAGAVTGTSGSATGSVQTGRQEAEPVFVPPPPPATTGTAPGSAGASGGRPAWLPIAGGALVVLILLIGIWAVFLRDTGGGQEPPVAGLNPTETVVIIEPAPTEEPTATEAPPTEEAQPTATAESVPQGPAGTVDSVVGNVIMINSDGLEAAVDQYTVISDRSRLVSGALSGLTMSLEDGSILQIDENSNFGVQNIAADPQDPTQESLFKLSEGNILLRQPQTGNALSVLDLNGNLLATLQENSVAEKRATMARRLQQGADDQGAMAILVEGDLVRITCFAGNCFLKDRRPLPAGQEIVITLGGVVVSEGPITPDSESYQLWSEKCNGCLNPVVPPIVEPTAVPPTDVPPTAAPTATPAPTEEPAGPNYSVRITSIGLEGGTYVVNYETTGYTEQLPGMHVHFYFDTVSEANAGVPGSGPWILYGGPRPFKGYSESQRPAGASSMCARVANPDHSIIYGTGNCYPLP